MKLDYNPNTEFFFGNLHSLPWRVFSTPQNPFDIPIHTQPLYRRNHHHRSMRNLLLSSITTTTIRMPPSTATKLLTNNHPTTTTTTTPLLCKHSPSATLDLLILLLVLFSGSFLLTSYFSYIFHSLSLLLSTTSITPLSLPYVLGFLLSFVVAFLSLFCGIRSRKCHKSGCKGLKKALEFDLQLQTEDCVKTASKEIDRLPWKGGSEGNPDYECLRAELRKMAPPNGRAVLFFRASCGCPVAKLEGWGSKRGRRHKKALANVGVNGGDHR
ncbi:hypothetical protein CFOL_v3_04433 [Cephalotus follicularis]|uniref:Uncharacterized protein n=1 Tax=Cephalotus follicularis TaxID=3775 RepID=A0A1Q3AZ33_CEPFO|nr:hypothetical protein CFOL_v3_04433 [Cephalotus follicularis]